MQSSCNVIIVGFHYSALTELCLCLCPPNWIFSTPDPDIWPIVICNVTIVIYDATMIIYNVTIVIYNVTCHPHLRTCLSKKSKQCRICCWPESVSLVDVIIGGWVLLVSCHVCCIVWMLHTVCYIVWMLSAALCSRQHAWEHSEWHVNSCIYFY